MDAVEVRLKTHSERSVVMGLIVSKTFCSRIVPILKIEAFNMEFIRTIVNWAVEYFQKYEEPIGMNIQSKFDTEYGDLGDEDAELIQVFLVDLSKDYERIEKHFNDVYFIDQAINYFRRHTIEITKQKMESCLDTNKIDEAFDYLAGVKPILAETSKVIRLYNPYDLSSFFGEDGRRPALLELDGAYGKMLGRMERGDLIAFLAPMKRGKSWFLLDLAYQALLNGLNVFYISHEMSEREMKERFYQIITRRSWDRADLTFLPAFDCKKNQDNSCLKKERRGGGKHGSQNYRPCTVCRFKNPQEFDIESTMVSRKIDPINPNYLKRKLEQFEFMYGKNFRMRCSTFGVTWPVIKSAIENTMATEDFYPDVVLEDYTKIRANYKFGLNNVNNVEMIDLNWKETKSYAAGRGFLWVTAHQGTRATLSKKRLSASDTSGFIDIVAHVNKLFALNQTEVEKQRGIMRINALAKRSEKFDVEQTCTVLQNVDIGGVVLDSQFGVIRSAYSVEQQKADENE